MKALSIKQPWPNRIASGEKTIETRTWSTSYRGPLLICASKVPDSYPENQPAGCAVAVADLVDCREMTKADEGAACCEIYPRAKAWVLENVRKIKPFPVRGMQRLFDVDVEPKQLQESNERNLKMTNETQTQKQKDPELLPLANDLQDRLDAIGSARAAVAKKLRAWETQKDFTSDAKKAYDLACKELMETIDGDLLPFEDFSQKNAAEDDAVAEDDDWREWREVEIAGLDGITLAIRKHLAENTPPIITLGDLTDLQKEKGDFWSKDIPGIGPLAVEKIADATEKFWSLRDAISEKPAAADLTEAAE